MLKTRAVSEVPETRRGYHDLVSVLRRFVEGDDDIVEVVFTDADYKNAKSCCGSLSLAIKRTGYAVKVLMRNNKVYLVKVK